MDLGFGTQLMSAVKKTHVGYKYFSLFRKLSSVHFYVIEFLILKKNITLLHEN